VGTVVGGVAAVVGSTSGAVAVITGATAIAGGGVAGAGINILTGGGVEGAKDGLKGGFVGGAIAIYAPGIGLALLESGAQGLETLKWLAGSGAGAAGTAAQAAARTPWAETLIKVLSDPLTKTIGIIGSGFGFALADHYVRRPRKCPGER